MRKFTQLATNTLMKYMGNGVWSICKVFMASRQWLMKLLGIYELAGNITTFIAYRRDNQTEALENVGLYRSWIFFEEYTSYIAFDASNYDIGYTLVCVYPA